MQVNVYVLYDLQNHHQSASFFPCFGIFLASSLPVFVSLQNMVPLLDGPADGGAAVSSQQQLQEQEKRIEISCALAAEASRRSRILSGEDTPTATKTNLSTAYTHTSTIHPA